MNLTTQEIIDAREKLQQDYFDNEDVWNEASIVQRENEKILLTKELTHCSLRQLSNVDAKKFKTIVVNQFYNPAAMASLACLTETIFSLSTEIINKNERIRRWFDELKLIGAESKTGYAFQSTLNSVKDVFIVKSLQNINPQFSYELLHEAFIGIYGTNRLRAYVPNFAYIFGTFSCSSPYGQKEVVSWCTQDSDYRYIIYENISSISLSSKSIIPSISMYEYMEICTMKQFLSIYMQILYALRKAVEICEFTHYDLHGNNVLIRTINSPTFAIPYETEKGIEYIITDGVATIIDYGSSHIVFDGQSYGNYNYPGTFDPQVTFPLQDAYKFFLTSVYSIPDNNEKLFNDLRGVFTFFSDEDMAIAVKEHNELHYTLPTRFIDVPLDELILYIRTNYDLDFIVANKPTNMRVLGCNGTDICLDMDIILNKVGANDTLPSTFFELADIYPSLNDDEKEDVKSEFNYELGKREYLDRMKEFNDILKSNKKVVISLKNVKNDYEFYVNYKQYILDLVKIIDTLKQINTYINIGNYIATIWDDDTLLDDMYKSIDNWVLSKQFVEKARKSYISDIQNTYKFTKATVPDQWYRKNLISYQKIILS